MLISHLQGFFKHRIHYLHAAAKATAIITAASHLRRALLTINKKLRLDLKGRSANRWLHRDYGSALGLRGGGAILVDGSWRVRASRLGLLDNGVGDDGLLW
jgi:hypothetical protein